MYAVSSEGSVLLVSTNGPTEQEMESVRGIDINLGVAPMPQHLVECAHIQIKYALEFN